MTLARPSFAEQADIRAREKAQMLISLRRPAYSSLHNALRSCLGCVEAAETEGLHELIAELRGTSEQTDRLIDLVERRLLYVRTYAEAALDKP